MTHSGHIKHSFHFDARGHGPLGWIRTRITHIGRRPTKRLQPVRLTHIQIGATPQWFRSEQPKRSMTPRRNTPQTITSAPDNRRYTLAVV